MEPAMNKRENDTQPATRDIAPQGDVILVVGTGDMVTKFRVFSQCLRAGSKVFAAMFGSNWSEGQGLSELSPKEVALPDDNPTAMKYICQALHFYKIGRDQNVPSPEQIVSMMIHADKYDAVFAVEPFVRHCLQESKPTTTEDRLCLYAVVCRLSSLKVEYPFLFDLVAGHVGSFFKFMEHPVIGPVLHFRDYAKIEEARMQLKFGLMPLLERENCDSSCEDSYEQCGSLKNKYGNEAMGKAKASQVIRELKLQYDFSVRRVHRQGQRPRDESCRCADTLYARLDRLYSDLMERLVGSTDRLNED